MVLSSCLASLPHFKTRTISNGKHGRHASGWPRSQITYGSLCSKALNQVISSMNTVILMFQLEKERRKQNESKRMRKEDRQISLHSPSGVLLWVLEQPYERRRNFLILQRGFSSRFLDNSAALKTRANKYKHINSKNATAQISFNSALECVYSTLAFI